MANHFASVYDLQEEDASDKDQLGGHSGDRHGKQVIEVFAPQRFPRCRNNNQTLSDFGRLTFTANIESGGANHGRQNFPGVFSSSQKIEQKLSGKLYGKTLMKSSLEIKIRIVFSCLRQMFIFRKAFFRFLMAERNTWMFF